MASYFKKNKKAINMTEKYEEDFKNINICRFCEKEILCDKICDHCRLTGKNRGPTHIKNNFKVTQNKCNIISFRFHNFSYYDCHLFFEKLVDKKSDQVKIDNLAKTNEEYVSVSDGCIEFIGCFRFFSNSLGSLVKTIIDNSHETLKDSEEESVDKDDKLKVVNEKSS